MCVQLEVFDVFFLVLSTCGIFLSRGLSHLHGIIIMFAHVLRPLGICVVFVTYIFMDWALQFLQVSRQCLSISSHRPCIVFLYIVYLMKSSILATFSAHLLLCIVYLMKSSTLAILFVHYVFNEIKHTSYIFHTWVR